MGLGLKVEKVSTPLLWTPGRDPALVGSQGRRSDPIPRPGTLSPPA